MFPPCAVGKPIEFCKPFFIRVRVVVVWFSHVYKFAIVGNLLQTNRAPSVFVELFKYCSVINFRRERCDFFLCILYIYIYARIMSMPIPDTPIPYTWCSCSLTIYIYIYVLMMVSSLFTYNNNHITSALTRTTNDDGGAVAAATAFNVCLWREQMFTLVRNTYYNTLHHIYYNGCFIVHLSCVVLAVTYRTHTVFSPRLGTFLLPK